MRGGAKEAPEEATATTGLWPPKGELGHHRLWGRNGAEESPRLVPSTQQVAIQGTPEAESLD